MSLLIRSKKLLKQLEPNEKELVFFQKKDWEKYKASNVIDITDNKLFIVLDYEK